MTAAASVVEAVSGDNDSSKSRQHMYQSMELPIPFAYSNIPNLSQICRCLNHEFLIIQTLYNVTPI